MITMDFDSIMNVCLTWLVVGALLGGGGVLLGIYIAKRPSDA